MEREKETERQTDRQTERDRQYNRLKERVEQRDADRGRDRERVGSKIDKNIKIGIKTFLIKSFRHLSKTEIFFIVLSDPGVLIQPGWTISTLLLGLFMSSHQDIGQSMKLGQPFNNLEWE